MRVSAVGRQERDTPTHLIKNCTSTHDGRVSKDRLVMADGTRTYSFVFDGTQAVRGSKSKQQLVEAFYTHDDAQTISTCSYTSCRETA